MAISKASKKKSHRPPVSHIQKPSNLTLEQWQVTLRKQIAGNQKFKINNIGSHSVFSDFQVVNPQNSNIYRVSIGGSELGENFCTCPDFATNTLGTCKHIESVLNKIRRQKGGRKALKEGYQWEYSKVTVHYGLKRQVHFCYGLNPSPKLRRLVGKYFDSNLSLTENGVDTFDRFIRDVEFLNDDVRIHQDAMDFITQLRDNHVRKHRLQKFFPEKVNGTVWKSLLKADLYPYQKEGILFAANAGRCLIADDMGLGKTIQAIGASEVLARTMSIEKVLIICPASLKYQWKLEIERFTNRSAQIIQGSSPFRHRLYQNDHFYTVVNYDVIHRDISVINRLNFDLIILDEAQRIKNWKTRLARSVKQLHSTYAFVLTGTPLENRLEELHSIVNFVDRYHLGPLFRFLDCHHSRDPKGKMIGYKDLNKIGKSLEPILIRRKRDEVLKQLPKRIDKNYFVPLTREQFQIHEEQHMIVVRLVAKWNRYHFLSEEDQRRLMMALQMMRMVSDNTYLVDPSMFHGTKVNELETQLAEIFEDPDAKVVIFSQWIRMMELIQTMLKANKWGSVFLSGKVPSGKRGDLIKAFQTDHSCRVFLSTEAGSTGLNLQNASIVINMDLPWNPAVLEQRIARVHRLGQKQPVRVINFISEGSIEHGMLGLLNFKRSMFTGVLDKGDNHINLGESRFSRFIKTVETATASVTLDHKMNREISDEEIKDTVDSREEISEEQMEMDQQEISRQNVKAEQPSLNDILQIGASFLKQIGETISATDRKTDLKNSEKVKSNKDKANEESSVFRVFVDPESGQKELAFRLPDDETIKRFTENISRIFESFKK